MRFEFEYKYSISYKEKRQINPRYKSGLARTEVDVREIDPVEAPLVARLGPDFDSLHGSKEFHEGSEGRKRELRYIEGRFYVEICTAAELTESLKTGTKRTALELTGTELVEPDPRRPGNPYSTADDIRREFRNLKEVNDDLGAEVAEHFRSLSDRFVVVDDVVFRETPEPIIGNGYGSDHKVLPVFQSKRPTRRVGDETHLNYSYAYDHSHSAIWSDNLVDALPRLEMEERVPDYEILDPRPFVFDGVSHWVWNEVGSLLQTMEGVIWRSDDTLTDAYYDLKEAFDKSPNGCVTTEILSALEDLKNLDAKPAGEFGEALKSWHSALARDERYPGKIDAFFSDEKFDWSKAGYLDFAVHASMTLQYWNSRVESRYWPETGSLSEPPDVVSASTPVISELNSTGLVAQAFYETGVDVIELQERVETGSRFFLARSRYSSGVAEVSPDGELSLHGDFEEELTVHVEPILNSNLKAVLP